MARSRFSDPIEPMDLENMRQNGVRSLWIQCNQCRHTRVMNVDPAISSCPVRPAADLGRIVQP
jgi:hypothetical protein